MPRKRKPGPRTKSGRPSRAYSGPARDTGTAELQAKRAYLINGSDPQLAASASGILLANGFLSRGQHAAALTYAWAHALTFGRPWHQACPLGDRTGSAPSDERLVKAKEKLAEMDAKLSSEQRQAVANLAVFGFIPQFFYTERLRLRELPDDRATRAALVTGLEALARA
jgi:hypothetical protein